MAEGSSRSTTLIAPAHTERTERSIVCTTEPQKWLVWAGCIKAYDDPTRHTAGELRRERECGLIRSPHTAGGV